MGWKDGILEEVKEFLEYLGKNHKNTKKKSWENLKKKFGEDFYKRIYDLCSRSGYITNITHGKGNSRYHEVVLDTKGLSFLEEQKRWKLQQNQIETQNFLTFGIFTIAFLQGILLLLYYYFDLRARSYIFYANSYMTAGIILLIIIAYGIIKMKPSLK